MIRKDFELIKRTLKESRSNGIYFRDPKWLQGIYIYLSKMGSLYIVYNLDKMCLIDGIRCSPIHEHDLPNLGEYFEIWDGAL